MSAPPRPPQEYLRRVRARARALRLWDECHVTAWIEIRLAQQRVLLKHGKPRRC